MRRWKPEFRSNLGENLRNRAPRLTFKRPNPNFLLSLIMNVSQQGEFGLITQLHQSLQTRVGTKIGIGDDGAVLDALSHPVITTDALVENVHFRRDWTSPRALGVKSMAVNLSDVAAMGAWPVAAFVSLALPPDCDSAWISELYSGMESLAARYNFTIAGGDMTAAPLVMISVTLVGDLMPQALGRPILRSGARVGDAVCVTGNLGDSAAGLAQLLAGSARDEALMRRHFEPQPRLDLMRELLSLNRGAIHAGLDLSDGLVGDSSHVARASGADIEIDAEQLPVSAECRAAARALNLSATDWALAGGEDYELCLCVAPDCIGELIRVGRVVAGAGEVRVYEGGQLRAGQVGWQHF